MMSKLHCCIRCAELYIVSLASPTRATQFMKKKKKISMLSHPLHEKQLYCLQDNWEMFTLFRNTTCNIPSIFFANFTFLIICFSLCCWHSVPLLCLQYIVIALALTNITYHIVCIQIAENICILHTTTQYGCQRVLLAVTDSMWV